MLGLLRLAAVTTVCSLGVGLLALLLALRFGPVPNWWPLLALDTFALYAFAPFLAVAAAALVLWSRSLAVLSVAALLFFFQQFSGPLLNLAGLSGHTASAASEDRPRLRILTMNLHSPNDDPAPFAALIRRVDPDVIMFQEVTDNFVRGFDRQLGREYIFSATAGTSTAHEGAATWSRYPLVDVEPLRPSQHGNIMHRVRISTGQIAGGETSDQGDLWLYNIHLPSPTGDSRENGRLAMAERFNTLHRDSELQWLIAETTAHGGPFILAGDFNTAAGSYGYRRFPSSWSDLYAEVGPGFGHTYPSPQHEHSRLIRIPLLRIDYVLGSPEVRPVRAWVEELPETDHLGIVVDVEF